MRRVLHTRDADKKSWGQLMTLVNEIVNSRPNSKLGNRSPAEVFTKSMSGDEQLIEDVSESILKSANAKRQPSKITPYRKGDRVRVIDEKYLAKNRSTTLNSNSNGTVHLKIALRSTHSIAKLPCKQPVPSDQHSSHSLQSSAPVCRSCSRRLASPMPAPPAARRRIATWHSDCSTAVVRTDTGHKATQAIQ